ncbi:MAG: GNAT family N-acetyltransferase [Asgard group archaeon]|nr:GNAT family N-acetyltransferase [Asgard group archaeon]
MSPENYSIEVFNPLEASDEVIKHFFDIIEEWNIEEDPDEPLIPRESYKKFLLDPHPHSQNYRWLVYPKEETNKIVGYGNLIVNLEGHPNYEENKHIGFFSIYVTRNLRRKGLGSKILRVIISKAKELNRLSTFHCGTSIESGYEFLSYYKGTISIESAENRLYISEVKWELMKTWKKAGLEKAKEKGITMEDFFECPEEIIGEYMHIYTETMKQQPLGELEWKPKHTPESRRLDEKRLADKGLEWYTMITKENDKAISGLTEYFYYEDTPHRIEQGLTGVKEEYRGRGLGKWLKAEMLFRIKERFPDVKFISTGNSTENAPMLSINERMGFKEFRPSKLYKLKLEELDKLVLSKKKN